MAAKRSSGPVPGALSQFASGDRRPSPTAERFAAQAAGRHQSDTDFSLA
jgi:hypothetical protein